LTKRTPYACMREDRGIYNPVRPRQRG